MSILLSLYEDRIISKHYIHKLRTALAVVTNEGSPQAKPKYLLFGYHNQENTTISVVSFGDQHCQRAVRSTKSEAIFESTV